jgi:shikimate dehydrogenase
MDTTEKPRLYGLIGHPARHSLSPFIMNRALEEFGIEAEYVVFDASPDRFDEAARSLRAMGIAGVNVTFPFKERILRHADRVSPAVEAIGAANTLTVGPDGAEADNTDAEGVVAALGVIAGFGVEGKNATILGAGGSARAAAYGLLEAGAGRVVFAIREGSAHGPAVEKIRAMFGEGSVGVVAMAGDSRDFVRSIGDSQVLINATPLGMSEPGGTGGAVSPVLPVDESLLGEEHLCFDFVYHPRVTRFIEAATRRGARSLGGLALLVAQARSTFRIWTREEFALERMYEETLDYARSLEDGE